MSQQRISVETGLSIESLPEGRVAGEPRSPSDIMATTVDRPTEVSLPARCAMRAWPGALCLTQGIPVPQANMKTGTDEPPRKVARVTVSHFLVILWFPCIIFAQSPFVSYHSRFPVSCRLTLLIAILEGQLAAADLTARPERGAGRCLRGSLPSFFGAACGFCSWRACGFCPWRACAVTVTLLTRATTCSWFPRTGSADGRRSHL